MFLHVINRIDAADEDAVLHFGLTSDVTDLAVTLRQQVPTVQGFTKCVAWNRHLQPVLLPASQPGAAVYCDASHATRFYVGARVAGGAFNCVRQY